MSPTTGCVQAMPDRSRIDEPCVYTGSPMKGTEITQRR
jgi:hypothetical protein